MFQGRLSELSQCVAECFVTEGLSSITVDQGLISAARLIAATQGIVYVIGNGGSAGIASHFANDLLKALHIPSQTLYDSNLMTCLSNDLGYEHVFSFPLKKLLKSNDLLVAISSSGKSPNILNATQVAIEHRIPLITLSGFFPSNPLRAQGSLNFWIDRSDYGLVESAHFILLHSLIDLWKPLTGTTSHVKNDRAAFAAT
ncbi:MAG TPA: SIS domain-containing protein [Chlamydiales bacterium]|jgi:D-sedoheptulose 7-phosphate isomerase